MDTPQDSGEDFAQLIKRLMDTYQVTQSEIARRLDISPSAVNTWVNRKRGTGRGPSPDLLRRLADEFPKFTPAEIFAAAGRRVPGPLTPDKEQELLSYFSELTEEQQRAKLVEMRALAEDNRS